MRVGPEEVEELFQLLYSQLRSDAKTEAHNQLTNNGNGASLKHRKRAANWFIDASDHLGGGAIIWDKRMYLDAVDGKRAPPKGCITQLDEAKDIVPRINAERFVDRMNNAKNPDHYARQQLLRDGMLTHATQLRDTMIMVNHSGVAKHVQFCDDILDKEGGRWDCESGVQGDSTVSR
jgi:hypothetical protein